MGDKNGKTSSYDVVKELGELKNVYENYVEVMFEDEIAYYEIISDLNVGDLVYEDSVAEGSGCLILNDNSAVVGWRNDSIIKDLELGEITDVLCDGKVEVMFDDKIKNYSLYRGYDEIKKGSLVYEKRIPDVNNYLIDYENGEIIGIHC